MIRTPGRRRWTALAVSCVWSVAWAVHLAPGFLEPRYTVRDASRSLGETLAGAGSVFQNLADGLFLDNPLRYRWIWTQLVPRSQVRHWTRTPHEYLVTQLPFQGDEKYLTRRYELVRSFVLYAPATRWPAPPLSASCPGATGQCVGLFRLRSP